MFVANRTCSCVTAIRPAGTQTLVSEHTRTFAVPGAKQGCSSVAQALVPNGDCFSSHRVSEHCLFYVTAAPVIGCDSWRLNVSNAFEVLALTIDSVFFNSLR
jgi:hypothetical protein